MGGVGMDGTPSVAALDGVIETFEVNLFGVIGVTQAFLRLLRAAAGAQILNISSGMGSLGLQADPDSFLHRYPTMSGYCASKAALNMFTVLLARELEEAGIRVNSVCPGSVMTDMTRNNGQKSADDAARGIFPLIASKELPTGQFAQVDGAYPW